MKLANFANLVPGDRVIIRPRTRRDQYLVAEVTSPDTYTPLTGNLADACNPSSDGKHKKMKALHRLTQKTNPTTGALYLEWEDAYAFTLYRTARDVEGYATEANVADVEQVMLARLTPIHEVKQDAAARRDAAAQHAEDARAFLLSQLGPAYADRLYPGARFSMEDVAAMIRTVLD